jgi:hypothetical protein
VEINRDVAICPFHGEIEGIVFYITKNMSALDALIEIRASQAMMEIAKMAAWMMSDFDNFMRKKI